MTGVTNSARTSAYKPALAIFAAIGSAWVFVLVTLGAFTTTIGAGMAFPDWPLSNGSINPHGWLEDIAMFAEHSHRLSGTLMGLIAIALALWLHRRESRGWLRKFGWWALAIVIVQGLIGGQRVKLDAWHLGGFEMSVGQMLRIPHGILAQVYVCLLIAIAVGLSRSWVERKSPSLSAGVRRLGLVCCVLLFIQLIIAATMRHNYAGLSIPTFPHSTPGGGWLPELWNFRVAIHFAHRVMAVILSVALIWFVVALRLDRNVTMTMRAASSLLVALLSAQVILGAQIIVKLREAHVTTGHVVCGAMLLATTFWLAWLAHRDVIETPSTP
ncbi:MAG TPA: COX15/CtaA family protein [Opitutaceae bacterium]|nr:COX15/CtaA family protein [Opitutaceae bacterium]